MDKKHLYETNGTGTNGNNEITLKVDAFVDEMCKNFSEFPDAELELYIIEDIMTRFCHKRILKRVENSRKEINEKKEEQNS